MSLAASRAIPFSIQEVGYDHPDAQRLIAEVQAEYVKRYGGPDVSPVDVLQFQPPLGRFAVGYLDTEPVAMGGWRRHDDADPQTSWAVPAAEVKRMYVTDTARGRGYARAVLAYLEDSARGAGVRWLLLETGRVQPEALALYESSGYQRVPPFGYYAEGKLAIHLGKDLLAGQPPTGQPPTGQPPTGQPIAGRPADVQPSGE
jgi:GNAT superfamily N-acetyltransferase